MATVTSRLSAFCALALLFACSPAPASPDAAAVRALLDTGKEQLARHEWSNAKSSFTAVLAEYDARNGEAHFGIALAETLFLTDVIPWIAQVGQRVGDTYSPAGADDESRYLNELITDAVLEIRAHFEAADRALEAVRGDTRFTFRIEALTVGAHEGSAGVNLQGEYDMGDALLLRALVNALIALTDVILSVDVVFDFPGAHAYLTDPAFDAGSIAHLMGLVTRLLNDPAHPDFLGLAPGGTERMRDAAHRLSESARDLELALAAIARESDDQSDDVLRWVDEDGDGRFTPLPDPGRDACAALAEAGADYVREDAVELLGVRLANSRAVPHLNLRIACTLQKAAVNLRWDDRAGLPTATAWAERPELNVLADLLPIVDAAVAGLSAAYPSITLGLPVPAGTLLTAASELLGDVAQLDPHAFFLPDDAGTPATVRSLIPHWTSACDGTAFCADTFALEMECSPLPATLATFPAPFTTAFARLDGTLPLCRGAWIDGGSSADADHFGGALDADGIVGYLPYIHWQDASFHGLLALNVGDMGARYKDSASTADAAIADGLSALDPDPADFAAASLADLNALTAAVSGNSVVGAVLLEFGDDE